MDQIGLLEQLIEESGDLERLAKKIQGEKEVTASDEEIGELTTSYQTWLARAVTALPDDLEERFRQEYEGGFFSSKIKDFLAGPTERSVFPNPDSNPLIPYWQNPFETAFRAPLLAQRQIIQEARQRIGQGSVTSAEVTLIERALSRPVENWATLAG